MLRLLGLFVTVVSLAAFAGQSPRWLPAEAKEATEIPDLLFRTDVAYCIDFDGEHSCDPYGNDADIYPGWVELLAGSDPASPISTPEFALLDEQAHWTQTCSDGVDNDLDGRSDRRDPGCHVACRDFKAGAGCTDHDHDGWLQYVESRLESDPGNGLSTPESLLVPGTCNDSVDNDLDGDIDGDDPECSGINDCVDFDQNAPPCLPF